MFSRTTIASSISNPTHRLSAISVIMLIVKPNRFMHRKVPISAIGKVRPVMTVERHADRAGTVANGLQAHTGRQLLAQLGHGGMKAVNHLDGVLALRLLHRQQ